MARRCSICRQPGHDARSCPVKWAAAERPATGAEEPRIELLLGDNLPILAAMESESFDLIYVDPPFNTRKVQSRRSLKTRAAERGDRAGFQGRRFVTELLGEKAYLDHHHDYLGFLMPRLAEAHRLLRPAGCLFVHLDYREVHRVKVALDALFGRDCFINEIIWAYDYGARTRKKWAPKHDNILFYAKSPGGYTFNADEMDRIPYMAPGLVSAEKAARGKTPTDVWWHTIVPTSGREKTGYPNQKPLGILERIVKVHSRPGDRLLDFFAGSGSFGEAAHRHGRHCLLIDDNPEAIAVMKTRFAARGIPCHGPAGSY